MLIFGSHAFGGGWWSLHVQTHPDVSRGGNTMRRLLIVFAVVALLTTAAAAPVAATGGTRHGDVDLTLYLGNRP